MSDGVKVTLDQWHAVPGDQLPEFMEQAIRRNKYVLIIALPAIKSGPTSGSAASATRATS